MPPATSRVRAWRREGEPGPAGIHLKLEKLPRSKESDGLSRGHGTRPLRRSQRHGGLRACRWRRGRAFVTTLVLPRMVGVPGIAESQEPVRSRASLEGEPPRASCPYCRDRAPRRHPATLVARKSRRRDRQVGFRPATSSRPVSLMVCHIGFAAFGSAPAGDPWTLLAQPSTSHRQIRLKPHRKRDRHRRLLGRLFVSQRGPAPGLSRRMFQPETLRRQRRR